MKKQQSRHYVVEWKGTMRLPLFNYHNFKPGPTREEIAEQLKQGLLNMEPGDKVEIEYHGEREYYIYTIRKDARQPKRGDVI